MQFLFVDFQNSLTFFQGYPLEVQSYHFQLSFHLHLLLFDILVELKCCSMKIANNNYNFTVQIRSALLNISAICLAISDICGALATISGVIPFSFSVSVHSLCFLGLK